MRRYPFDPARAHDLRQSHAATATRSRQALRSSLRAWMSVPGLCDEEVTVLLVCAVVLVTVLLGGDR